MGSTKAKEGGGYELMALNRNRLEEWKRTQRAKMSEWSLEEMLRIQNSFELRQRAMRKDMTPQGQIRLPSLFYAEAWSWCYFLWNYKDGKYRQKFLDYFKSELHGKTGYKFWAELWGKTGDPDKDDWSDLDKEWRAYVETLYDQMGIK
jgi:hypothetical protein